MSDFRFNVSMPAPVLSDDAFLNATDAPGEAGCTDASIRGHSEGMELLFGRTAESFQEAFSTAIAQIQSAGSRVAMIEVEHETMSP